MRHAKAPALAKALPMRGRGRSVSGELGLLLGPTKKSFIEQRELRPASSVLIRELLLEQPLAPRRLDGAGA